MNDTELDTKINLTTTTPISRYKDTTIKSSITAISFRASATDNSFINDSMYPMGECDSPSNLKKSSVLDDSVVLSPSVIKLKKVKFLDDVIKTKVPQSNWRSDFILQ